MGWHYMQKENWAEAIQWFKKSLEMNSADNEFRIYYRDAEQRLLDQKRAGQNP
jgi:hypothetical protein